MPLDRPQLDTLIGNLESGAATLQQSTDANTAAQTQAATCKAALDAATKANQDNVTALKAFVSALDSDGNDPATPPTHASPANDPQTPQDATSGTAGIVTPPAPSDAPAATGTPAAPAPDQTTA